MMGAKRAMEETGRRALFVGPGRARLVAEVAAEKARDPFCCVRIVVPNAATAESLRDLLARGRALVNVHIQTVEKAAAEFAEPRKLRLPSGAERLLMRDLIRRSDAGERFRELGDSAGFLGALHATLRDLLDAGLMGPGLEPAGAASPELTGLLALARASEARRRELDLDDDSARFVDAAVRLDGAGSVAGCVILFGLFDATGLQERFLTSLLTRAERARVFLPGHAFAAAFRGRLAAALEVEPECLPPESGRTQLDWLRQGWDQDDLGCLRASFGGLPPEDGSVRVFSMPGGEVGAELLARHVAELLDGEPKLAPSDVELVARGAGGIPVASLVRELVRLGVPVRRSAGSLGETAVGRVVLALAELLAAPRVSQSRVIELASDLPWRAGPLGFGKQGIVRAAGAAECALWDRLGREAGLRVVIDADSSSREAFRLLRATARSKSAEAAAAFGAWIDELASLHKSLRVAGKRPLGWGPIGIRLVRFLEAWTDPQAEGFEAWRTRLLALERVDALGQSADAAGLLWLVAGLAGEAFEGPLLDPGGVRVGKLAGRRGARARRVFLLDGDEGSFPRSRSQNVLLGDADRRLLGSRAPGLLADLESHAEERALFAELCALAVERLVLVTTRPGIEKGAARPSRLVAEALGVLGGDVLRAAPSLEALGEGQPEVPNLVRFELEAAWRPAAGAASSGAASAGAASVGAREGVLFALDRALAAGLSASHARRELDVLAPSASVAMEVARRARPGMSAFDGALGCESLAALGAAGRFRGTPEKGLSPSRLETFASCGMRAFLRSMLGVEEAETPEESRGILAAERGTRVHQILECFGKAAKSAGLEPWSDAPLDQLKAILFGHIEAVIGKARASAPADQADLWDAEAARYRGLLSGWLHAQRRDSGGWVPEEFEWRFAGVRYELGEGQAPIYLRGTADRVDLRRLGGEGGAREARVVDYKTGKGTDAKDESTRFGQSLQLALYGAAARAHFGAAASEGLYDFVFFGRTAKWSGQGKPPRKNSKWVQESEATARAQVRVLVEAMEAGHFWPTPKKDASPNDFACQYCGVSEACGPWREDARGLAAEIDPVLTGLHAVMAAAEDEA